MRFACESHGGVEGPYPLHGIFNLVRLSLLTETSTLIGFELAIGVLRLRSRFASQSSYSAQDDTA